MGTTETETRNNGKEQEKKPEGQVISTREGIYRLLKRLENKHTPLKLNFDAVADKYTSMVIAVNYKEGYFLLDEVTPRWGDDLMAKAIPFSFESFHDGCRISASLIQASGRAVKDGAPVYKVPFPKNLHFLQRRQFYRAPVRMSLEIKVRLGVKVPPEKRDEYDNLIHQDPTWEYEGLLRDLSAQGGQVDVEGSLQETLEKNTQFDCCHIIFPNGDFIELGIIVRHIGYDEKKKVSSLGCQFTNLDPKKDQKISFVVTELQRDHARNASGNASNAAPSELFEPAAPSKDKKDKKKEAERSKEEANKEEKAKVEQLDTRSAHQLAVKAVRTLVGQLRNKEALDIQLAWEAANQLLVSLEKQRQELILYTRIRSTGQYLFEHSVSVAVLLADQMMFDKANPKSKDDEFLRNLIFAGLCHDLGKGLIPERIIGKTSGLTDKEAKVMHKHSLLTREILSRQPGTPEVALQVATQNCERLDGSGHPEGLKGISISPVGKLAAVIDVFDAMTNGRSYRAGIPHALAFKRLLSMNNQLDQPATQQLIKHQGIFPIGSLVSFANGDLGFVKSLTATASPDQVRLVFNKNSGRPLALQDIQVGSGSNWTKVAAPEDPAKYKLNNDLLLHEI
ncbi:HD-GYP domain, c-di-GMP phosphodiesterase class II (or its inactivated variant) [Marinospirillum celere]|uniref:HD-GYP domain, c-di-GMP phosphodiesterase class II (Or its inactivated variant) n=1 Tax=Marinospirillum celere TaxID=1122252 RepID=A0A1I1EAG3_9GAMM|nr:flagellar brake protein [Marinospirillum celere]SFB82010.1 HD-GYP domain, c-di-GMP phosphodiesterase class II (or its inactivated variant) [Marinospirillum celere]